GVRFLAYRITEGDKAGTAAQRALVARAMLRAPPTRTTTRARERPNRPMREMLDAEIRREDILRKIVRKLTANALDGDLDAIREIFDRMDGNSDPGPNETPGTMSLHI